MATTSMLRNGLLHHIKWSGQYSSSIFVVIMTLTLSFAILVDSDQQQQSSSQGIGSQESEETVVLSSAETIGDLSSSVDSEVEIEDVEIEGAGGTLDVGEGTSEEDGVPGSGNQNGSDPTAVAKVYDEPVPNFVSKEDGDGKESGSAGGTNKILGTPPKHGRVKVVCWDYRKIQLPLVEDSQKELKRRINVSDEENLANSSDVDMERVNGDEEDQSSSGEDTGVVMESEADVPSDGEEVQDVGGVRNLNENGTSVKRDIGEIDFTNRSVEIVNMTTLLHEVLYTNPALKDRATPSNCSIVMFYAEWCPFSAKAAPHFNALPRAYPPIRVAAIDSSKHRSVNTYFGILSVPSVVLFHNGKIIAKFNDTSFTLNKFAEFVEYFTDLKHEERMNVTTKDFEGPLSSVPKKEVDWYLYLAWIFIIGCFLHYVTKSAIWKRAIDYVRTAWREAEAQHEHID